MDKYWTFPKRKYRILMTFTLLFFSLVILAIVLRLSIPRLTSQSVATGIITADGREHLGDCPDTPNCQGSESSRASQRLDRFALTQDADLAIATLSAIIASEPGGKVLEKTDRYLHASFTTRVMGYVDDVEFLLSDDNRSMQVRSASRLGVSDLGANAKRIESLRKAAQDKL